MGDLWAGGVAAAAVAIIGAAGAFVLKFIPQRARLARTARDRVIDEYASIIDRLQEQVNNLSDVVEVNRQRHDTELRALRHRYEQEADVMREAHAACRQENENLRIEFRALRIRLNMIETGEPGSPPL